MTMTPNRIHLNGHRKAHTSRHVVQFYESDDFLIESLARFIMAGIAAGEACIVVATKAHHERVQGRLLARGLNLPAAQRRGDYLALDTDTTLATFMVGGMPDPNRFTTVIGSIIERAAGHRRRVRIFGEMVALLWMEGNAAAAIELEKLWNDLRDNPYPFSLFCAYAMSGFAGTANEALFTEICRQHSDIIPDENYTTLDSQEERLHAITALQQKAASLEAEIAERKAVEERLRIALAMQKQLEEQKDAFISMASHELKTPVTSLKGFAQVLKKRLQDQADPQMLLFLDRMDTQLKKLTNLISDLLDISKMQTGTLTFRETIFDLDELVRETIENVQATTATHHIRLEGATHGRIYGDRDRLGQVLINLLTNAIKYSPKAETVIVRLGSRDGQASVAVRDFGIGIAEEQYEHIFQRFYQVADPVQTCPGLGIGLYIAGTIVERHGGRIWVESQRGAGSTFFFTLQLCSGEPDVSQSQTQRKEEA